jgi:malonyl-CoA O-methyltransferase
VANRFERFAAGYKARNFIQRRIASELIAELNSINLAAAETCRAELNGKLPKREFCFWEKLKVLDLGSGDGAVYSAIADLNPTDPDASAREVKEFFALDFSKSLLQLHPSGEKIRKIRADFNDPDAIAALRNYAPFDLVISSCSLQWAGDLANLLAAIAKLTDKIALAILTDRTLAVLRELSKSPKQMPSAEFLRSAIAQNFPKAKFQTRSYRAEFADTKELFKYIRESGVGGGEKRLNFAETKRLIAEFPHKYLDYEALFAIA